MADRDYKAFIVEGEAREPLIIDNISKVFFAHGNFKIITLPAGFDYDGHQNNLAEDDDENVLDQMLISFDNETENGKLYISYPMVEALRDFESGVCGKKDNCFVMLEDLGNYKFLSAEHSIYPQFNAYSFEIWKEVIAVFSMRLSCLVNQAGTMSYDQYAEAINPLEILKLEEKEIPKNRVFVLSAFPEFLLDYFGVKLWKTCVKKE